MSVIDRLRKQRADAEEQAPAAETPAEEAPAAEAPAAEAPAEPDVPKEAATSSIAEKKSALARLAARRKVAEAEVKEEEAKEAKEEPAKKAEIPEAERCVACGGSGKASKPKGAMCKPCEGTGRKKGKAKATPAEVPQKKSEKAGEPAALEATEHAGRCLVVRHFMKSGELVSFEEKEELIEIGAFAQPPATVGCILGMTVNMGDYELAKISVNCSVPCHVEEADGAFTFSYKFASDRVADEVAQLRKAKSGK